MQIIFESPFFGLFAGSASPRFGVFSESRGRLATSEKKKEVVVTVPDWEEDEKSFWGRTLDAMGLKTTDN